MIIVTKRRRKILWQIFPSFLIITVLSLTAVTWYSTTFFKSFFLHNTEKDLTIRAQFIKREFISRYKNLYENVDDIDKLCKEIGQTTETRVTIILPSGEVIGDSQADIRTMENHKHRYEIALALRDRKGVSIRKSDTVNDNMMYIAIPVIQDNMILSIVRVAISISSIEKQIRSIQKNILFALFITVVMAAGASLLVARRITRPIEEMRSGANRFACGDLTTALPVPDSEELFQLALTMNQMAQSLDDKMKTLENRSMELEAIHSSMKEGVIAVDPDEKIITANHAAAAMFGYPAATINGKNILEISRHYELQRLIREALSNPEPVEEDIVITRSDEQIYNVHSTALCNSSGKRLGTLIIFHDITRIRKLETMHKDFASNVSHELKTPLTSIKGFVETLENLMQESENKLNDQLSHLTNGLNMQTEKKLKFLKIIEKNVDRLIALINDLLSLSRVEREEGSLVRLEPHDIAQTIQGAIDACMPIISSRNITVQYSPPKNLTALIDPILMEQAIVNLLDNAIKYSASGNRVIVTCEQEIGPAEADKAEKYTGKDKRTRSAAKDNLPVHSGNRRDEQCKQYIVISIIDYGSGIGKEHLSRIFQRFYRVDRSRSREVGGTGLGLAIVKHIVRYHKGEISVSSVLGKGSTFRICLPSVV